VDHRFILQILTWQIRPWRHPESTFKRKSTAAFPIAAGSIAAIAQPIFHIPAMRLQIIAAN
jgi:hypothetical protein